MGRSWAGIVGLCALLVAGLFGAATVPAAEIITKELPILLSADEMSYDRQAGLIVAKGHVEASQDDQVLLADQITYNQHKDVLTATGHISLLEPDGTVLFGDHMELTGDLKDGIIENLGAILTDNSRFAASGARRSNATILELTNAVYSPCNLCVEDPTRPPLWQIRAVKVIHDSKRKTVEYKDAWLEVWGVPVAYTPYFVHPDPSVKRQSGFLTPSIGNSSDLGFVARVPYYIDIAPDKDATLTPIITTEEGPVMAAEYRQHFGPGPLELSGSITRDSQEDIRGHIRAKGRFDIDPTWRWGLDVNRATDDTYMRRYGFGIVDPFFGTNDTLTSQLFAEGFRRRNYASARAFAFQGLRINDDPGMSPLVLPLLEYNHVGEADRFGGRTNLDVNLLALTRSEGTDTRRLAVNAGWQVPRLGPLGSVYTLSASLRGGLYHVNKQSLGNGNTFSGVTGRLVPQVALDWRLPFIRDSGRVYQIVEPIAEAVVSPNGGNPDKIPNEDSVDFVFDDTNLFTTNRFTGHDRVEGGTRFNYGLKWGAYGQGGGSTTVLVGQTFRVRADNTFGQGSGLEDNFSDLVGKIHVVPSNFLDLLYRTRLSKDNFEPKRNELRLSGGPQALRVSTSYIFFDRKEGSEFTGREEVALGMGAQLTRYWRANLSGVRDLAGDEMRSLGARLTYEDECCVFSTSLTRTFFQDRDLKPTDAIIFRVLFKTLGEVGTGFSRSQ